MYLAELKEKNDFFIDRIERLNINTLDLDFLDEKIRKNTGYVSNNELSITIE